MCFMKAIHEYDEPEEETPKKVKEISFKELKRNIKGDDSRPHRRRRVEANDPYFDVLDSGRDFLVWVRRHKEIKKEMTKDLTEVFLELERLLHKMQSGAINDDYDYSANVNACYFDMAEIFNVLGNFRMKLGAFLRNEKYVMSATGMSQKSFSAYKSQIKGVVDICNKMERNIRIFMERMEKEYGMESVLPEEIVAVRRSGDTES